MRRALYLTAVFILAIPSRDAVAQVRQQSASRDMRDTLPERVVQRTFEAFIRKDLDATFANYDTTFAHEYLGDPAGPQRVRRADWLRKMKSDTASVRRLQAGRVEVLRHDVFGNFVNNVWVLRSPDGKEVKHFELIEVRHGKIVREIES
jgi:ketosteroid isomerase-like protein